MRFPDPASPTPPGTRASVPRKMAPRATGRTPRRPVRPKSGMVRGGGAADGGGGRARRLRQAGSLRSGLSPSSACYSDGADLTRFAGTGRDLTDLVVEAHLVAVPATCHYADDLHNQVEAKVKVTMTVSRGPAMPGRTVEVPYFIAVAENDTIYDKQVFTGRVDFPANTDRLTLTTSEISLLFPVSHDKSAAAYKIWVSYQLTPDELAANRTRAGRVREGQGSALTTFFKKSTGSKGLGPWWVQGEAWWGAGRRPAKSSVRLIFAPMGSALALSSVPACLNSPP